MKRRLFCAMVVGAAIGGAAMPAFASVCYEIIDRNDVVLLRDTRPPVDLSLAGAPLREAIRGRGELLVIFDVENCRVLGRASATGSRTLTTDEIVASWRAFEGKTGWGTYGGRYGGQPDPEQPVNTSLPAAPSTPGGPR